MADPSLITRKTLQKARFVVVVIDSLARLPRKFLSQLTQLGTQALFFLLFSEITSPGDFLLPLKDALRGQEEHRYGAPKADM